MKSNNLPLHSITYHQSKHNLNKTFYMRLKEYYLLTFFSSDHSYFIKRNFGWRDDAIFLSSNYLGHFLACFESNPMEISQFTITIK